MAAPYTRADAAGLYLSGEIGSDTGGTVAGALGGWRMPVEVMQLDALIEGVAPSVVVEQISGMQGAGAASIRATATDKLAYTPAGLSVEGSEVTCTDGASVLIEGADANNYLRIRIDGDDDLVDGISLDIRKPYNGLIGGPDVTTAESAAGVNTYLAGHIFNHGEEPRDLVVYIGTLGTQRATGTAQLGASGSGVITTATTNGFADWPAAGWARIRTSGGTLREIVYYSSRSATSLVVLAAHRGLLGTTAAAGSATDLVDAVPGIRISVEEPNVEGEIDLQADINTAPSGASWSTAISSGAGLAITGLAPLASYGLRIHREIPAGATASYAQENVIAIQCGAYTQKYCGLYRIASASAAKYEAFIGEDARPDFSAADQAETALPFDIDLTPPVSGTKTFKVTVRETDTYGLSSYNTYTHDFEIDDAGELVNADITPPQDVTLTEIGSGFVQLQAQYPRGIDADTADVFRYYVTTDGTDPDPATDTPVQVTMQIGQGLRDSRVLDVILGPYTYATDLRVLVTSYRTADTTESENTTPTTATIALVSPATPARPAAIAYGASSYASGLLYPWTETFLDAPLNLVKWRYTAGVTELWLNSGELILRGICGGLNQVTANYAASMSIVEGAVSGTGLNVPIEVVDATEVYICVDGVRRVKIDTDANTITAAAFEALGDISPEDAPVAGPAYCADGVTYLQVFDPVIGRWRSFLTVNSSGTVSVRWLSQSLS
jgi:hypothetical protein